MWQCHKCGEEIEDTFDACWWCGTGRDGTIAAEDFQQEPDDPSVPDPGPEPEYLEIDTDFDDLDKLVTIATYNTPSQAEVARLILEEEGIKTFLADDNLVGMNWFLSNAVGGAKLQVAASEAERAKDILKTAQPASAKTDPDITGVSIAFLCQNCRKIIDFTPERHGCVEVCPNCGKYVDVPEKTDRDRLVQSEIIVSSSNPDRTSAQQTIADTASRSNAQVWMEVIAVLCLAYMPALNGAFMVMMGYGKSDASLVHREWLYIIDSLQVVTPLLLIIALTKDPWKLFGILRPKWIIDILSAIAIWLFGMMAYHFALSFISPSLFDVTTSASVSPRERPEGILTYFLIFISCALSSVQQEFVMRGYLIPRLEGLLHSTWKAIVVTSLLFGSYHIYQGIVPAIACVALGVVYAIAFCMLRRLWPLCIAHTIHNFLYLSFL
jgi:membrane protease YdiL (CAAX protease family)